MIKYVSLIILYLLIITSYFSYVIYEETQIEIETFDLSIYKGTAVDFSGELDLRTITDVSLTKPGYKEWDIVNEKLVYDSTFLSSLDNPLMFEGINKNDENIYDVTYIINNTENLNFDIWITKGGFQESASYIMEYNSDTEVVAIYRPYLHTTVGSFFKSELISESISLNNTNTINTKLDIPNKRLQVSINDNLLIDIPADLNPSYDAYAGIKITEPGHLEINAVISDIIITDYGENDTSFIGIVSSLLVLNVNEKYLPLAFNIILIKFPIIVLTIAIAFYLRGVQ